MSQATHATAQEPDLLLLDGERVALNTNPLRPYLEAHPKRLPRSEATSTANWRGYIATFVIRDDVLIADKVEISVPDPTAGDDEWPYRQEDVSRAVFQGQDELMASWYSGTLVIPRGEVVSYVHMGYGSTYERYTLLKIVEGRLVSRRDLEHAQFIKFRDAQFEAFKKTPEYAKKFRQAGGRKAENAEFAEGFLREYESEHYLSQDYSTKEAKRALD